PSWAVGDSTAHRFATRRPWSLVRARSKYAGYRTMGRSPFGMDPARIPAPPYGFGRPRHRFDIFIPDVVLSGPLSERSVMEEETDLANFALDYATTKGVSYAEARYEHQEQENFILKNGVLDALYVGQDRGVGVRVL